MVRINETVYCQNCGVEVSWSPLIVKGQDFCCKDCFEGRSCDCGERMELEDDRRGSTSDTAE